MLATVPIVGWIGSSFLLHGVGLALPNGLQGVYRLQQYHESEVHLETEELVEPSEILARTGDEGLDRLYWLRLEVLGDQPVYVAKPGPFDVELVYDARTGRRLDPLSDEAVRSIADAELEGSWAEEADGLEEFNRYYLVDRVPAVALTMEGDQPTELVISRSGRTLRRTDPLAAWFHTAYRSVHVWQWGDGLRLFTSVLYGLVGLALTLVSLGYTLWWTRREARRRWTPSVRPARRIHGRLAPLAGMLLATQMLVGAFLWYNLGLIEPRFRGQGSFEAEWSGGLSIAESLAAAATIAAALPQDLVTAERPIQRYEWRAIGDRRFWLAYPTRDAEGILIDASSGARLDRLTKELAQTAGESVVNGLATADPVESTEYWMDFNARVPTYRFRFADPDETDVHVSQISGEVVQRRPAIWRGFGPFLSYHTFSFSGNPWFDTFLLTALQLAILVMVFSGWRLALSGRAVRQQAE
jgi:hypothetical protein